eukprot:224802-Chlamydomonas_euryale.AAC.1
MCPKRSQSAKRGEAKHIHTYADTQAEAHADTQARMHGDTHRNACTGTHTRARIRAQVCRAKHSLCLTRGGDWTCRARAVQRGGRCSAHACRRAGPDARRLWQR